MATQPMPPSDMATLSRGCRTGYSDQSHSAHDWRASCPKRVAPIWSAGPPGGAGCIPELPTWSETTVSVSTQAAMIGSQWSRSQRLGSPTAWGRSGRVMETKPRSALRWISRAASVGSERKVMPHGTIRSGWGSYHSVNSQSFHARMASIPTSVSSASANTRPQNPVIWEGKLSIAQMPATSMSAIRASTS